MTASTGPSDLLDRLLDRTRRALPDVELSESRETARHRIEQWRWPAFQMGLAAALSLLVADRVAHDAAGYAPITAIAALGLGRERRLGRSGLLVAGLLVGVVAAELVTPILGSGWWQVGLLMAVSAVIAGALVGHELAVTYAVINAAVLLATPGSDGWVPHRLLAGLVGVGTALAIIVLIAPPRPVHLIRRRLDRAARRATDALTRTATILCDGFDADDPTGDARPPLSLARRLDDEIEQSHATVDQALELVRWSPVRRRDADEVRRLQAVAHDLRPALRTASTIARLGDRAALEGVTVDGPVCDGIDDAADTIVELTHGLLERRPPDTDRIEAAREAVERVISAPDDRPIVVALREEVRGLFADLGSLLGDDVRSVAPDLADLPSR